MLAFFFLAFLVRCVSLGRYVTNDEPIWVMRAVQFSDAVAARDWSSIPQTGHPGVTTMALGALGVRLTTMLNPVEAEMHLNWIRSLAWLSPENSKAFPHLAYFLTVGRVLVAIVTSFGISLSYALARRRLDARWARWLALCLALDPFFIGHSGLLHTDALQATFAFLAVLLVLPVRNSTKPVACAPLPSRERVLDVWLLAAALCLALAGITKTLGLLIAPGLALAMLWLAPGTRKRRLVRVIALTLLSLSLTLLLYPPCWTHPERAIGALIDAISYHESIGLRDTFFAGRTTADPGLLFYPVVLCFRLTPPVLSGLASVVVLLLCKRQKAISLHQIGWCVLPTLSYLMLLSLATKKFDRYALTLIPLLSSIAALYWGTHKRYWRWLLASLLFPWSLVAPLPLMYADPLLGGPWLARYFVPLGWGEGSGLAATWAARTLPDAETRVLLTDNVSGAAAFFPGATFAWDPDLAGCADILIRGTKFSPSGYDYTVLRQVGIAGIAIATLYQRAPVLPDAPLSVAPGALAGVSPAAVAPAADTVTVRDWLVERLNVGDKFLWIHAPACYPITEAQLTTLLAGVADCGQNTSLSGLSVATCTLQENLPESRPFQARFGGTLDFIAATWPATVRAPDTLTVHARWRSYTIQGTHTFSLALEDADGNAWVAGGNLLTDDRGWPASTWAVGEWITADAYLPLPLTAPPGSYTLTLRLFDAGGRKLGVWDPDGVFLGTRLELSVVKIEAPRYAASTLALPLTLDIPLPGLRLIGAAPPFSEHWAGDPLPFRLGWERTVGEPPSVMRWLLTCNGELRDAGALPLSPGMPATWPGGHRYEVQYAPSTDPLLAEGTCELAVQIADGENIPLGTVVVHQRPRSFSLPHSPQIPLTVTVGNFAQIVGADISAITPGQLLTTTLYWKAQSPAPIDYTVFVHLLGPDGHLYAQSDNWPAQGMAPTTSWLANQIIVDSHTLVLPADAAIADAAIADAAIADAAIRAGNLYRLLVGLYDAESGGRVPLYDATGTRFAEDSVPIAEFTLTSR
ncbi:MAG: hypothetical protein JXA33_25175 [Anaerolineae bacterium]|nr:hypothetical protein [Anaerolineae bacterium]